MRSSSCGPKVQIEAKHRDDYREEAHERPAYREVDFPLLPFFRLRFLQRFQVCRTGIQFRVDAHRKAPPGTPFPSISPQLQRKGKSRGI